MTPTQPHPDSTGHNWPEPRLWSSTDSSGYGTDAGSASSKAGHRGQASLGSIGGGGAAVPGSSSATGPLGGGAAGVNGATAPSLAKANSFHSVSGIAQRKVNGY